jgi:cytochrome P450
MGLIDDVATLEVQRHPLFLRTVTGTLRRKSPVIKLGNMLIVTGEAQVREVFSRPTDFLFGFGNGPKMKLGPFLLGMDASDQYFAEKKALHSAAASGTWIPMFAGLVAKYANALIAPNPSVGGRVDLVSQVIEPILLRAAAEFYGLCLDDARSAYVDAPPGVATFAQWVRKLGGVIGSTSPAPFGLEALANRLAPEMATFLLEQVKSGKAPKTSVIHALNDLPNSPLQSAYDVARCVGGLVLAGAAMIKATTLALHELLLRRQILRNVVEAAQAGDKCTVLRYAWEALRFHPVFPILTRYCPRATTLATGTPYETPAPAGASVYVSPLAAMFDPLHVESPDEFIPDRPPGTYYHFGFGLHGCLGEQLAAYAIRELLTCLLARWKLTASRIVYEGPAVIRYETRSEPSTPIDPGG